MAKALATDTAVSPRASSWQQNYKNKVTFHSLLSFP